LVLGLVCGICYYTEPPSTPLNTDFKMPVPTDGTYVFSDMESLKEGLNKKGWFELLHNCDEYVDWRAIEVENSIRQRKSYQQYADQKGPSTVHLAQGSVVGEWTEKGSSNQEEKMV